LSVTAAQAEEFLRAHFDDEVRGVLAVGHGEWSKAFTFARPSGEFVIRFSPFQEDFLKDQIAAGWRSAALPIPPILELGSAFDGFFAIAPRVAGAFLDDLDGARMRAMLPALFGALDAARLVDVSTTTSGYGMWNPRRMAPHASWRDTLLDIANDSPSSRCHGWRTRLVESPTGSGPFDLAFERLRSLVEVCPEERHLLHGDLLNYNVLVGEREISAVIDWGNSLYGDFLYDVAWFAFWAPWYPAWSGIDFIAEAARHYAAIGLDVPQLHARMQCYLVHIGLDSQAYNAWKGEVRWPALEAAARRTLEFSAA
jgi:hygromycin-B 4-O-kinase